MSDISSLSNNKYEMIGYTLRIPEGQKDGKDLKYAGFVSYDMVQTQET